MSVDQALILTELSEMLRGISDSLLPGEDITPDMKLLDDLELQSIGLARLAGRVQARYGTSASPVPLFMGRDGVPLAALTVDDVVGYIAGALGDDPGHPALAVLAGTVGNTTDMIAQLSERMVGRSPAPGRTFAEDGFTAPDMLRIIGALEGRFGPMSKTLLYEHASAAELASHLDHRYGRVRAANLLRRVLESGQSDDPASANSFLAIPDSHHPTDNNAAVLAEQAPGTARTLLRLPDGDVEVFRAGDGPPLIMMHPINVGAGVFARQFANLAGSRQLICVHHPGVGATTWDADLTLGGIARLYRTVLAELAVSPPFHVLGVSFGGMVAQEFALLHPGECASLTLACCSYRLGGRPEMRRPLPVLARDEFDSMCHDGANLTMEGDRGALEKLLLRCESMDPRTGLGYLNAFTASAPNLYADLPDIITPTLILRGRHDTMVPAKHSYLLYGAIPGAELAELPDAGHFACLTHSAEVSRLVTSFLAAHAEAPTMAPRRARRKPARRASLAAAAPRLKADAPPLDRAIILSSGRCGSTLLSNLIAEEPETLSVYESLVMLRRHLNFMPTTVITGPEYWGLMSNPTKQGAVIRRIGATSDEACYPSTGRWANNPDGVPPILHIMLPRMSDDPDQLFDKLGVQVEQFPPQPVTLHHRMLLDLLATMAGRRRWVERSGASSALAEPLLTALPELKVVYLTRDITATARSMSKHTAFQFAMLRHRFVAECGYDPYSRWLPSDRIPDPDTLPAHMQRLLPERITIEALREMGDDVGRYETLCAHMMGTAEQALTDLQPRCLHRMQYEKLQADPRAELTVLGEFLGFADPAGWAASVAKRVRSPRAAA